MADKTQVIGAPYRTRRAARKDERFLQANLQAALSATGDDGQVKTWLLPSGRREDVPSWARGAQVQRQGPFQHALLATSRPGH